MFPVLVQPAVAQRQTGFWSWFDTSFDPKALEQPYLEDGKTPHAYLWRPGEWSPQDWITARGSAEAVLKDLFKADIISELSSSNDVPVVEVGHNFMMLSQQESFRVINFLDFVYGITKNNPEGVIDIEHDASNERIGIYTARGLQMQ